MLKRRTGIPGIDPKLLSTWIGAYRIIELCIPHAIIVSLEDPRKHPIRVHLNQVKRYNPPTSPLFSNQADLNDLATPNQQNVPMPGHNHQITPGYQMLHGNPDPIKPTHSYELQPRRTAGP
ncbi:unnamed protein product [Bursaphelenchus okinawaensis]|uniref:Uncharacterized protein n=1 Tax=Bursaphelenchus okinawaensis TaxID=465554 RepID=A0A811KQU8_9BILA|nr:unnamed protein product [Bursaphelenchus okinawaensis]CAG9107740.1 unnamed protein product [Bursaphelenchus okinawaensis]